MFGYRRELCRYEEVDEDELLASLSVEEIQELEQELDHLDPDTNIPIGLRQKDQTAKAPGGNFNHEALLKYWEEENKKLIQEEKEEAKPAQKEKQDKSCLRGELETPNANKPISKNNVKKRLTQRSKPAQNGSTKDDKKCVKESKSKVANPSKSDRKIPELNTDKPSENPIVIDTALEQILKNDPTLTEVNLNNKEDISQEILLRFIEALCTNTYVQLFSLANTHADDKVAFAIAKMLQENSSIKNLNIESNFVSGQGILAIMGALCQNQTLVELRFHNQRHICGGKAEMEMVQMLRENATLLKLGYQFELPGPRMAATSILTRNQDQQRQKRMQDRKAQEEVVKQVTNQSTENKTQKKTLQPAKTVEKPKNSLTSVNPELPTRKIAEMVKQQEKLENSKTQIKKPKTKKVKNGTNEKESGDILKELRNSLKPSVKRREEPSSLPPPQRSGRDDLMAAIRGSSMFSLKRVDLSNT
ncbi:leiomodin-2a isoform X1 [Periophthalmus magnuspinnatus]|uniref:leiomodin-2a isoform X1 n=1 Tax=Periophthalmus magnuspinnatus TaxID=409849 RepID=UPI0024369389|nr:leiomodin-2a isoform X1 [Periophthalmus magnuspinnatus]